MLQTENQRLKCILNATTEGWWEWDVVNDLTYRSEHWYKMLGLEPQTEPNGYDFWLNLIHPEDRMRAHLYQKLKLGRDKLWESDFRMKHAAGHYVHIRARGRVVERDAQGNPTLVVGIHLNVTKQKELEKKLSKQVTLLEKLSFENAHEMRAPVANILAILQLIREEMPLFAEEVLFNHLEGTVLKLDNLIHGLNQRIEDLLNQAK